MTELVMVRVDAPLEEPMTLSARQYLAKCKRSEIDSSAAYTNAGDEIQAVKRRWKDLDLLRQISVTDFRNAMANMNERYRPALDAYKEAEQVLKDKVEAYHEFMERLATERERNAEILMGEQRHLLENLAQEARTAGDEETALEYEDQAVMSVATREPLELPRFSGHFRHGWIYEVVDFEQVPREFLKLDDTKVALFIRENKGNCLIRGLKITPKKTVVSTCK